MKCKTILSKASVILPPNMVILSILRLAPKYIKFFHQIRLQLVSIGSKIDSSQEFEIIIIIKDSRPKIFYFWLNTDVYVVVLGRFSLLFLQ